MDNDTVAMRANKALSTLSRAERRVAVTLLADYPSAALTSAARLAERAEVSNPTVLRLAQTLGYEGFPALQAALRSEISAQSSGPITRLAEIPEPGTLHDRLLRQARLQTDRAIETMSLLSESMLERAVELLADTAHPVYLHGGRYSRLLAANLAGHLEQLRPRVSLLTHPESDDLGTVLDLAGGDAVVIFDFHRYQRTAADLAGRARRAAAAVILITDDLACPIAPDADMVLATASTAGTAYHSMTGGFLLTELLIQLIMDHLGEPARTRMALWEEQRRIELLP